MDAVPKSELPLERRMNQVKCRICSRNAVEKRYCEFHLKAYNNIVKKFELWKEASDDTWREYLIAVQKNSLTGLWAKEVAKLLIEDDKSDVK